MPGVGYIACKGDYAAAPCFQGSGGFGKLLLPSCGYYKVIPSQSQKVGECGAQASTRSGDQCHL